jgi:hypothetical protein
MTVVFAAEPGGSRAALEDGLRNLAANPTPAAQAHLAAIAGAEAPPPLPVSIFTLDDLAAGKDPRTVSPIAWEHFLVANGQAVRTAEVMSDPQGGLHLCCDLRRPGCGPGPSDRGGRGRERPGCWQLRAELDSGTCAVHHRALAQETKWEGGGLFCRCPTSTRGFSGSCRGTRCGFHQQTPVSGCSKGGAESVRLDPFTGKLMMEVSRS